MGTTPFATNTDVSETIGGKEYSRALLRDGVGADAMGLVQDTPAPYSLLGRVKAIVDAILTIAPARNAFAITKSDSVAISPLPRAVRVDTAGTVVYRAVDGTSDVTITAFAGEVIQARVQYIRATGTQPTAFVGLA